MVRRSRTVTCYEPWTCTGMKTVSSAAAATAGWERLDPPSTQKETSSSAKEITSGKNKYHISQVTNASKEMRNFKDELPWDAWTLNRLGRDE